MNYEQIYAEGFHDGREAAEESGTAEAPVDGWDGWTISAIGREAFLRDVLGFTQDDLIYSLNNWMNDPTIYAGAIVYNLGAQHGADSVMQQLVQ